MAGRKRQYTNNSMNTIYCRFVDLGTPHALKQAKIFGSLLSAFTAGFTGQGRCRTISRGSRSWAAYYAGMDAWKTFSRQNKAGKST